MDWRMDIEKAAVLPVPNCTQVKMSHPQVVGNIRNIDELEDEYQECCSSQLHLSEDIASSGGG